MKIVHQKIFDALVADPPRGIGTIGAFGLGVAADRFDGVDVPYVFHEDGFVVMASTGSAGPANAITVQHMITDDEIVAPGPEPSYVVVGGFTDPSSGSAR